VNFGCGGRNVSAPPVYGCIPAQNTKASRVAATTIGARMTIQGGKWSTISRPLRYFKVGVSSVELLEGVGRRPGQIF